MSDFDLDVVFDQPAADISHLNDAQLEDAINALPETLAKAALPVLLNKHTLSQASQDLGMRQAELVRLLHRAKNQIAENSGVAK
jgi:DNA-directed RNA polymerase specialized sigma24 family protein